MLRIGHDTGEYAIPGSTASIGSDVRTRSVPPRCALVAPWPGTQMPPLAAATPPGRLPRATVDATMARCESIRVSFASASSATQTSPAVTATAFGDAPTGIVARIAFVAGSICETVPSRLFATQTDPAPNATAAGPLPTLISPSTA